VTTNVAAVPGRSSWLTLEGWRRLFRDRPLVPLSGLLIVLVVVLEIVQPGTVSPDWIGVGIRAAVPLAILAACQTLAASTSRSG
jgi:ribose transport system permease protein